MCSTDARAESPSVADACAQTVCEVNEHRGEAADPVLPFEPVHWLLTLLLGVKNQSVGGCTRSASGLYGNILACI